MSEANEKRWLAIRRGLAANVPPTSLRQGLLAKRPEKKSFGPIDRSLQARKLLLSWILLANVSLYSLLVRFDK